MLFEAISILKYELAFLILIKLTVSLSLLLLKKEETSLSLQHKIELISLYPLNASIATISHIPDSG